jgi:hypothetical protein
MPKYKNEKVMWSKFKLQVLIRCKGHLEFRKKLILQGGTLLLHRIFLEFEGNTFFSSGKIIGRCERNDMLNS